MPEEIEQIMREIHILFAKAEKLPQDQKKIIVDKEVLFRLLERLDHEVYETMDRFEETKLSRQRARKKREEEERDALEHVSKSAEQIYAASILYSDDTLDELQQAIEEADEKLKATYRDIERQMKEYLEYIQGNKKELHEQLEEMAQRRIYLEILEEKTKPKPKTEEKLEKEKQNETKENRAEELKKEIIETEKETKKIEPIVNKKTQYVDDEAKKVEIVVKTAEDIEEKVKELKEAKTANLYSMQEVKTEKRIAASSVLEEAVNSEIAIGKDIPKFQAEDFDLDAEYFEWAEGKEAEKKSLEINSKKGLRDFFKRNK